MRPERKTIIIEDERVVSITPTANTKLIVDNDVYSFDDSYVLPSFVESHAHIIGQGEKLVLPDIQKCKSFDELIEIAKISTFRKGDWLFLRGWDDTNWETPIDQLPEAPISRLDSVFPSTPVALVRVDGHAMFINTVAIKSAHLDVTVSPPGGSFTHVNGRFTGLSLDTAMQPIYDEIPEYSDSILKGIIHNSLSDYIRQGVTEIHDMDVYLRYLPIYEELARSKKLPIKIYSYIRAFDGEYKTKYPKPSQVGNLNICGLKFYADGALGSRGALLFEPYSDIEPSDCTDPLQENGTNEINHGLQLISKHDLLREATIGCVNGWEIAVHAIGDKAVKNVIDVYIELRNSGFDNVLRIEHSQIVKPEHLQLFKDYDITPSVQSIHCTSDAQMAVDRLGNRIDYAYPWNSFLQKGISIIAGSDAPIETNSVLEGLDAFVNRIPQSNVTAWNPREVITIDDALYAYCCSPRYRALQEGVSNPSKKPKIQKHDFESLIATTGSFIILNNNFESTTQEAILATDIKATVANGKILYISPKSSTA